MWIYWLAGSVAFVIWLSRTASLHWSAMRVVRLDRAPDANTETLPRLSIVLAALNEEHGIEPALKTLLALSFPNLEIIAVNDRSTDRTGKILDRLAAENDRLRVYHIHNLPSGWLGKNHALHFGSQHASGDWILFTDADVHFEPAALSRAMNYAISQRLDHLVVMPELILSGRLEKIAVSFFMTMLIFRQQIWKVPDVRSNAHIGLGAFNLVRAESYRRMGGHAALPMDVIDDVKLGKLMKEAGGRADFVPGGSMVKVQWVNGVGGLISGLTKNAFAGLNYNALHAIGSSLLLLVIGFWPLVGLWVGPLLPRLLSLGTIACMVWALRLAPPSPRVSPLYGLCYPIAALILVYIILRSMVFVYRDKGVVWRGTHYSLAELRRGLV
ncbi:MAG: glycosyltransferase [Armatimonadetes bacterium]|nr:glycosyltransferase [Armatimonadota bacterium]